MIFFLVPFFFSYFTVCYVSCCIIDLIYALRCAWVYLLSHSCPKLSSFPTCGPSILVHIRTQFILSGCFGSSGPGVKQPVFVLSWADLISGLGLEWLCPLLINIYWSFLCGLPYAVNEIGREYNYPFLEGSLWSR